jgi:sugar phosphate isomerase/epimerase
MYAAFGGQAVGVTPPFDEAVELAAHYGFKGIYLDLGFLRTAGPAGVVQLLEDRSLEAAGWVLPFSLTADDDGFSAGLEQLAETAELCSRANCLRCIRWISPGSSMPYDETFALLRDRVNAVCAVLAEYDVRLGLEFVGPATSRQKAEYESVHTLEQVVDLWEAVDVSNVGLLADCWHFHCAGIEMDAILDLPKERIVDVHVSDAPEGVPRDELMDNDRRLPGETGVIDARRFLECLQEIGYTGPVMVEPIGKPLHLLENHEAIRTLKESLDSVWPD